MFARAVDNFPLVFNSGTRDANLSKAIYWWKKRGTFTETLVELVAIHLGELKRGFESGKYDENAIENIAETHFVIDFDNWKTLRFGGDSEVKYADVCFRPNASDLCQPADSFVIAKIKDVWRSMWNGKKIDLIYNGEWQNKPLGKSTGSGKLKNPGKGFFLSLAAKAIRQVNAYRDKNNLNYARKAMIRCGCSLDVDGVWRVKQLYPHLQELIKKYPAEFAGSNKNRTLRRNSALLTVQQTTNQSDTVIIARPKFKVWYGCITYVAL
ncbi:hypothetical protein GQ600_21878 [Phytophthora cactorum]|nr:hypothetical protein GQ600_21878 [Phytophthora cactorum]